MTENRSDLAQGAIKLARYGWAVFPLRPGTKYPATDDGFKSATTNVDQVKGWFSKEPYSNIGIATGGSSIDVLDFDCHDGSREAFEILSLSGLLYNHGTIVKTRSNGLHVYFKGSDQGNTAKIGGWPVDFRSTGGYVVAPPSVVEDGEYSVILLAEPGRAGMFDLAAAKKLLGVCDYKLKKDFTGSNTDALVKCVSEAPEGSRHPLVFWALCRCAEHGLDPEPVISAAIGVLGLPDRDVQRSWSNAQRNYERK